MKKLKLFSGIFIGVLLVGIALPAVFGFEVTETVTISPMFDTSISERNQTNNYCNNPDILIGRSTSDGKESRGIIRFDLSGIPSGATVSKADLTMYFHKMEGTGAATVGAFLIANGAADCSNVTWLQRSASSNWISPGGDYISSVGAMDTTAVSWDSSYDGDKHILDVKYFVERYANGYFTGNYGFMLIATSSNDKAQFYSVSSAPLGKMPVLVVTYTVTTTTPPTKPDLAITQITKNNADRVILNITNMGTGTFSDYLGLQIWFNGISKYNATTDFPVTIPAGGTGTITLSTLILPDGSTSVRARLDPNNIVDEENEDNNIRTETITIGPYSPNNPPQAYAGTTKYSEVGQSVGFNGGESSDTDGTIVSYSWNYGDGYSAQGAVVNHTYSAVGTYIAYLTVMDNNGATDTDSVFTIISASGTTPPYTNILPNAVAGNDVKAKVGEQIHFDASGSSDPDGTITKYSWNFGDTGDSNLKEPLHAYATPGVYTVTLITTDNNDGTDNDVIYVTVEEVSTTPKGVPGFEVPGVLGAAALVYYYFRRRKN